MGSANGAVSKHIRQWVRQYTREELEYFALFYPAGPWKKLANLCHFHPKKVCHKVQAREVPQGPVLHYCPDSKVHWINMGPIWGRQDPGGPHVGPMNFAIGWLSVQQIRRKQRIHCIKGQSRGASLIQTADGLAKVYPWVHVMCCKWHKYLNLSNLSNFQHTSPCSEMGAIMFYHKYCVSFKSNE